MDEINLTELVRERDEARAEAEALRVELDALSKRLGAATLERAAAIANLGGSGCAAGWPVTSPDDETLRAVLADFATATAKRPPCEAGLDPDACDACIAFTTESLEAGVRLWGQAQAPRTIKALASEVLRLRGLISERCAAIETGPVRRRIPGCQTEGPCYICDYPQTATASELTSGGGGYKVGSQPGAVIHVEQKILSPKELDSAQECAPSPTAASRRRAQLDAFESRYGMTTQELRRRVYRGEQQETDEISVWLMTAHLYDRLVTRSQ